MVLKRRKWTTSILRVLKMRPIDLLKTIIWKKSKVKQLRPTRKDQAAQTKSRSPASRNKACLKSPKTPVKTRMRILKRERSHC